MSTTDTSAADAAAQPAFPHPVGTPPGGGLWRWDTHTGQWLLQNEPVMPAAVTAVPTDTAPSAPALTPTQE